MEFIPDWSNGLLAAMDSNLDSKVAKDIGISSARARDQLIMRLALVPRG
ncbi:MAG: hypothetical protein ACM3X6_06675 [Patescibacteria group bacterium]